DDALPLLGPPGSALAEAAARAGVAFVAEAFADRGYLATGRLVPRDRPDALVTDTGEVAARAVRVATERRVRAVDGSDVAVAAESLCLHGDTPGAADLARAVRDALERAGVDIAPFA